MEITICDVQGCKKYGVESVDTCYGWLERSDPPPKEFNPFEKPDFGKRDLCAVHFKAWCKGSYESLYGKVRESLKADRGVK